MELVEEVGDLVVDVLASVVGVEGLDGEGEGGDEVLQHEHHDVAGPAVLPDEAGDLGPWRSLSPSPGTA